MKSLLKLMEGKNNAFDLTQHWLKSIVAEADGFIKTHLTFHRLIRSFWSFMGLLRRA